MGVSGIVTGGTIVDPSTVTVETCVQEQISGIIAADPNLVGTIIEDCAAPAFDITSFSGFCYNATLHRFVQQVSHKCSPDRRRRNTGKGRDGNSAIVQL